MGGCRRVCVVYLCDDGKDPKKAAYVAALGPVARCGWVGGCLGGWVCACVRACGVCVCLCACVSVCVCVCVHACVQVCDCARESTRKCPQLTARTPSPPLPSPHTPMQVRLWPHARAGRDQRQERQRQQLPQECDLPGEATEQEACVCVCVCVFCLRRSQPTPYRGVGGRGERQREQPRHDLGRHDPGRRGARATASRRRPLEPRAPTR